MKKIDSIKFLKAIANGSDVNSSKYKFDEIYEYIKNNDIENWDAYEDKEKGKTIEYLKYKSYEDDNVDLSIYVEPKYSDVREIVEDWLSEDEIEIQIEFKVMIYSDWSFEVSTGTTTEVTVDDVKYNRYYEEYEWDESDIWASDVTNNGANAEFYNRCDDIFELWSEYGPADTQDTTPENITFDRLKSLMKYLSDVEIFDIDVDVNVHIKDE